MRKPRRIFIGYTFADLGVALALEQWLRHAAPNVGVFLADDYASIPPGAEWFPKISSALSRADALIVLVSSAATRSTWVSFEAGFVAARGRPVVPLLVPPFRPEQLTPPLAFRQWIRLSSEESLSKIQKAIGIDRGRVGRTAVRQQAYRQIARACKDRRKVTVVDAMFLTSREDMYSEITELLNASGGPIHVRATSTLREREARGDAPFERYFAALAARCSEAPHLSKFTLVMSFPATNGYPPANRCRAIRRRQRIFSRAHAEQSMTILHAPVYGTIDVITIGYEHAVVGLPISPDDSHLRAAIRVSDPALVATLTRWFDERVLSDATIVDPVTLKIRTKKRASRAPNSPQKLARPGFGPAAEPPR